MSCTCGEPSKANWWVEVIIGRDVPGGTETTSVDAYLCNKHELGTPPSEWRVIETNKRRLR